MRPPGGYRALQASPICSPATSPTFNPLRTAGYWLGAIKRMWDAEREGPDEVFSLDTHILAVYGSTAVVQVEVRYGRPLRQQYRDLLSYTV